MLSDPKNTFVAPDEPALAEAVRRLVRALQPECIYLFGSRARGEATEDSDYDLMVITAGTEAQRYERARRAYAALGDVPISIDVLIWTRGEFDEMAPVVASLPATVIREGRLLYAA